MICHKQPHTCFASLQLQKLSSSACASHQDCSVQLLQSSDRDYIPDVTNVVTSQQVACVADHSMQAVCCATGSLK